MSGNYNAMEDFLSEEDEPVKKKEKMNMVKEKDEEKIHSWGGSELEFYLKIFVIQSLIEEISDDVLPINEDFFHDFIYDFEKHKSILKQGIWTFIYKKQIYLYTTHQATKTITIRSNKSVALLVKIFDNAIKNNNPYRNKNLEIVEDMGQVGVNIIDKPNVTIKDVILDDALIENLHDNTVFQLQNLDGSNGIILHGIAGSGKSHICKALINECLKEGLSTCFVASEVDFSELSTLVNKYLTPCLVVLEDIDSYVVNRDDYNGSGVSDFLQMVNGIRDTNNRIVYIATTNYLEKLDRAVADRPMRFNRKFKFSAPDGKEIKKIIELYFKEYDLTTEQKEYCYEKSFTGAHFSEILRTAKLLSLKRKVELKSVFIEAVKIVEKDFVMDVESKIL